MGKSYLGRWSGRKSPRGPGKHNRKGLTLAEIIAMFPDDQTAEAWFEALRWEGEITCPRCGADKEKITECRGKQTMPYWCRGCRKRFSVRIGTAMEASNIPFQKWAIAIYLYATSVKGISSLRLHRDIGVSQPCAWFMLHRIREAFSDPPALNSKEAEIDETYVGGIERNKHADKKLRAGRGTVGKTIVAGMRDRRSGKVVAEIIPDTKTGTLQAFAEKHLRIRGTLYTDDAAAYRDKDFRWPGKHRAVKHGRRQYADGNAHTNGIESFWAGLKRAHKGTFHKISTKHLQRYLNEFCAKHNIRNRDTIDQMIECVRKMTGKRLTYKRLTKKRR